MHYQYLSTHPEGFNDIIVRVLERQISDVEFVSQGSKESIYRTARKIKTSKLPFFETSYLIIKEYKPHITSLFNWSENNAKQITGYLSKEFPNKSFRVVCTPPKRDKKDYSHRMNSLHEKLVKNGLKIDKGKPDIEVKLFISQNTGYVTARISSPPESIDTFQKGGIRKEIAYLLVELSDPSPEDIFCDPMCGSGMIPITRALHSEYSQIYAYDLSINLFKNKINEMGLQIDNLNLIEKDFLASDIFTTYNKFVIDPPWGLMKKVDDLGTLYKKLLEKVAIKADVGSTIIILTSQSNAFDDAVKSRKDLINISVRETEVSGMQASVYQLNKAGDE